MPLVTRPIYAYGAVAISAVAVMHLLIAGVLATSRRADYGIAVTAYLLAFDGLWMVAVVGLIVSAVMAIYGLRTRRFVGLARLAWFVPQQAMMTIVVFGVLRAVYLGHYADQVVRGSEGIFVDQLPVLTLFYVHASGIWRRARDG